MEENQLTCHIKPNSFDATLLMLIKEAKDRGDQPVIIDGEPHVVVGGGRRLWFLINAENQVVAQTAGLYPYDGKRTPWT